MTRDDPRHDVAAVVAALVAEASDGQITAAGALAEPDSLALLGLTSLGQVRLIQAVERRFGIAVEPDDDLVALDTVESLARYLRERGVA
ncbi:acyl carrier protein [Catenulispora subtropica]|uniref:Carrier domain-containing protein n=1 Tax=Catenulispora subtropica TaxID=450798 RepID=A0ABP5D241_9ACTN